MAAERRKRRSIGRYLYLGYGVVALGAAVFILGRFAVGNGELRYMVGSVPATVIPTAIPTPTLPVSGSATPTATPRPGTPVPSPTALQSSSPAIFVGQTVDPSYPVQVVGHGFQPGDTVEILYGPQGTNGCATRAATATVGSDGTFVATFIAPANPDVHRLILTAVDPPGSCGGARTQARTSFRILAAAAVYAAPPPSNTDNPLNLPTPVLQVLFVFATLSGIASLFRFLWDALRGALGLGKKALQRAPARKA